MIEAFLAVILLAFGLLYGEPIIVLASSLYAIAVNIGNLVEAVKK